MTFKKVLFLDFDGVLNHEEYYKRTLVERLTKPHRVYAEEFDEHSMECLNRIVSETGAVIVVSSSWRGGGRYYVEEVLYKNGFKGEVVGTTPYTIESMTHSILRGDEIKKWLDFNTVENYAIVDDCGENCFLPEQLPHFVQVDDNGHGLGDEEADMLIKILNNNA